MGAVVTAIAMRRRAIGRLLRPATVYAYDINMIDSESTSASNTGFTSTVMAGYNNTWDGTSFSRHWLMRFDLRGVATPATVELRVTSTNTPSSGTGLQAREMLREYVAGQATWNNWATGQAWSLSGARSNGNDRGSTVAGSTTFPSAGTYTLTVTSLVSPMVGTVAKLLVSYLTTNTGATVYGPGGTDAQRPALLLTY